MNLFDLFSGGTGRSFYMRDFRNAYHYRPDVNPPRQAFNGYVNFVFNRNVYDFLESQVGTSGQFRTQLSSKVKTADIPSVQFKTETLPQYNKKKIVNTGVEYEPVNITVYDTVGNEWLTVLMKYFSYHFMNPRNKSNDSRLRDPDLNAGPVGGKDFVGSSFGGQKFDSNAAGYNTNITPYFFERIDYVLYHGNKGVQYSLINPVLTGFKSSTLDYASSAPLEFQMSFAYESFTIHNETNFQLGEEDFDRFENAQNYTGNAWVDGKKPEGALKERKIDFLGAETDKRNRAGQPGAEKGAPLTDFQEAGGTSFYTTADVKAKPAKDKDTGGFGGSLLGKVADAALTAAIHGQDVKDVAIKAASSAVTDKITSSFKKPGG